MAIVNDPGPTENAPAGAAWLKRWLDALRSWLQTREPTAAGDPYEKFITRWEMVQAGLMRRTDGGRFVAGVVGGGAPGPTGPPGPQGPAGTGYTPDLTPPPTPGSFTVSAGITNIFFELPVPAYTEGNGHSHTNIYGAVWAQGDPPPTFSDIRTKLVDTVAGKPTVHNFATQPDTRWAFWIKWVTRDGVESTNPSGGTNGQVATTGQDVTALLGILAGEITESQLYSALNTRINLVDASAAVPGSVNARIASSEAGQQAYVQSYTYARATTDAIAGSVTTLQAQMNSPTIGNNPTYAAVQTEQSARVALDGSVAALYTVRVEASAQGRQVVGGFGLSATSTTSAGPRIDFGVRADRFWIAAPGTATGVADIVPFIVQTTTQTINGATVPPGVYMDTAFIRDGTITSAKIGSAQIDDAKIANLSASKLSVGDGTVGGDLKSTTFSAGSGSTPGAGWRIRPDGSAYFNNGTFYGTIYASAGVFSGSLSAATGTFAGALSAATGTFAGALSAATGTFAGSLSAATGTLGTLEIASGGHIRMGKANYADTTAGFWQGSDSGTPKLVIGNSSSYVRWTGSALEIVNPTLNSYSVSLSGGAIEVTSSSNTADQLLGTRTASASGGQGQSIYSWAIHEWYDVPLAVSFRIQVSGTGNNTCAVYGDLASTAGGGVVVLRCTATDANGRTAATQIHVTLTGSSYNP